MDPMMWQIVAAVAVAVVVTALAVWLYFRKRHGRGTSGVAERDVRSRYTELHTEFVNLRDRQNLMDERLERFERTHTEARDRMASSREDFEARLARYDALDQRTREIQEQIYEIRNEHKVLMERDERHERRVNELQDQLSEIRTDVRASHGNGDRKRVRT